jgi:hypothetical protein
MANTPNTQPLFIRDFRIWSDTLQNELGTTDPNSTLLPKTLIVADDPSSAIETIHIQHTGLAVATTVNLYLWHQTQTDGRNLLISQTDLPEVTLGGSRQPIVVNNLPRTYSPNNGTAINYVTESGGSESVAIPSIATQILRLPLGWELRCALSVAIANPIILTAFGGSYY